MTAVLVLPGTAPETDWHAARREGSRSEIAVVMGLAPGSQNSPYALYHRKLGALPEVGDNDAMERGRVLEPYVALKFARQRPDLMVTGSGRELYAHPDRSWQLATPDRVLCEPSLSKVAAYDAPLAVLECKTDAGGDDWGDEGTEEIPVHYRAQVLWQMDVLGVTTAFVACLLIRSWKVRVYEITLGDQAREDLEVMRAEAEQFRFRLLREDPPAVDWTPATSAALRHLHPDLEDRDVEIRRMPGIQYRAACKAYKAAEQRKKLAENRLRLLLGNGHRVIDGVTGDVIATRQVYDVREHTRKAARSTSSSRPSARKPPHERQGKGRARTGRKSAPRPGPWPPRTTRSPPWTAPRGTAPCTG